VLQERDRRYRRLCVVVRRIWRQKVVARSRVQLFSHHARLLIHRFLRLRRAVERRRLRRGHRDAASHAESRPRTIVRGRKTRNCVGRFQSWREVPGLEWSSLAPRWHRLVDRPCRRPKIADCDAIDHRLATVWMRLHPRSGARSVKWGLASARKDAHTRKVQSRRRQSVMQDDLPVMK